MMTLIIPDVHLRYEHVDKILKHEAPDRAIFLGDHFDQFDDDEQQNKKAAQWIKDRQNTHPEDEWLWGNHDTSYAFSNRYTKCSGYDFHKDAAINSVLSRKEWDRFKFYTWLDDKTLLSHAGLHPYYLTRKDPKDSIKDWLAQEAKTAYMTMCNNGGHWMYGAGYARGGSQPKGGVNWLDWNQEFTPIKGLNQVVGHTVVRAPGYKEAEDSWNYNLDTCNSHYGVWNGKQLKVNYAPDEIREWRVKP